MNINFSKAFPLFFKFALARILIGVCFSSYPYADEFWQGPEIAHRDVYGYGHLTWEWTREKPLRSPLYHQLFTVFYHLLKYFKIENDFLVSYGPRMIQCFLSAILEVYTIQLMKLENVTNQSYMVSAFEFYFEITVFYTTWFALFCFSKTIINNFETTLFAMALYYWQHYEHSSSRTSNILCRILVSINTIARPTSLIPWVFIWPYHLLTFKVQNNFFKEKINVLFQNIVTLILMSASSIAIDCLYYGKFTWTLLNFLDFNLMSGACDFYGIHSTFWLFYAGLPYVFLGWIILLLIGIYSYIQQKKAQQGQPTLIYYAIFFMAALSLPKHKEDRFLLPIFPIFFFLICHGIEFFDKLITKHSKHAGQLVKLKRLLISIGVITNLIFFLLMTFGQDVGAIKTLETLKEQNNLQSVEFFVQCHSTPYYSFLHRNIPMNFPDCSPRKDISDMEAYLLQKNTLEYIQSKLQKEDRLPSHLVIYNYLYRKEGISQLLEEKGYSLVADIYHQFFIDTYFADQYDVHFLVLSKR